MTLKNTFQKNLDSIHKQLTEVSDWMYENPELGFNEFKTSEYLVKFIESFNGEVVYPLVNELGIRVKLLGTPAEEGGGGKIILLENGNFEDAACSMMIHPGYENVVNPTFTTIQQYKVEFFGKDAHAAGAPEEGINALDAQIQLFVNASTYRQQMVSTNRMHGVITNGGFKPNIILQRKFLISG